jgi:hypothetical protein
MPKADKTDTTDWLLTGDEPEQEVRAQTANEQAVLRMLRAIPWEHQATALAAMEGLARGHPMEDRDAPG